VVHSSQSSISISIFRASTPFYLTAPPTPTLFSVFTFHHRRSPFITGICTPSIRCLRNNFLSIIACIEKVFACCLYQEHKRLPIIQPLHSLCSELHLGTLLLLAPVVSLQYLIGSYGYSCTISVCSRAISVLQISLYSLLIFDSSSSCHNTYPSQNRVSIFISLLYFSFIIRVFINSPFEKSQSPNLTSLEKSPLHQILEHTEPKLFPCVVILLVFNYFITNCYIYKKKVSYG